MPIEAVMLWNEPQTRCAASTSRSPASIGGISPIDARFITRMRRQGVLDRVDVIAVHGFPLDWNHWQIREWPDKLQEIREVTDLPIWVSEVGVSTFGAEEVQLFGLKRTMELILDKVPRVHWYSLYDLPKAWPATTRHREAEGSSYYRHFYMGVLREDGSPKIAADVLPQYAPEVGVCQWFHFEDPRLDCAVHWLKRMGIKRLRTGLSWADHHRPNSLQWFDRQMKALGRRRWRSSPSSARR